MDTSRFGSIACDEGTSGPAEVKMWIATKEIAQQWCNDWPSSLAPKCDGTLNVWAAFRSLSFVEVRMTWQDNCWEAWLNESKTTCRPWRWMKKRFSFLSFTFGRTEPQLIVLFHRRTWENGSCFKPFVVDKELTLQGMVTFWMLLGYNSQQL